MWDGEKRREEGEGENGDGYPRGKQFLLIQRSHPHGGASLVDPLLDLSPSRSVSLPSFLSRSRVVLLSSTLSLSLYHLPVFLSLLASLFLSLSLSLSFSPRANLASANKCSFACHPRQSSVVFFPSPLLAPSHHERYRSCKIRRSIHRLVFRIDCFSIVARVTCRANSTIGLLFIFFFSFYSSYIYSACN